MATTTRRKTAPKRKPAVKTSPPDPVLTEEQRIAKFEAYQALSAANLPIPADLQEVEGWIAETRAKIEKQNAVAKQEAEAEADRVREANNAGPWYVRNGYVAPFNLRLDRQTEKRRIELKPRGMPGDMHPLKEEDLKDPNLKLNLNLGIVEVIPAGEAALIMEKQTTNMGNRVHVPLAVLRSESGNVYEQGSVKVEAEFNSQGVTVAQVDPRTLTGELHDKQIGGTRGTGGITRSQGQAQEAPAQPEGPQPASSIVRSGFVPTGSGDSIISYGPLGRNAEAKIADDIARRTDIQGPAAGLGSGVQVTVDPVRKT